jgi:hypothetical protein
MKTIWTIALLGALASSLAPAAKLAPETIEAFDAYVASAEAQMARRVNGELKFLRVDEDPALRQQVRRGKVVIDQAGYESMTEIPGGLVHDWVGGAFVAGATLDDALALSQDFDSHEGYYQPEVVRSRLIKREGDRFQIFYRLLKKKVITVVLDTEHEVNYYRIGERRAHSKSYTTRISEVKNAGKPNESALPDGVGGGYLWRLNSYWAFEERDGGVYIELRAISLTRGIPAGTGWLVKPIVRDMPRISINGTLTNTREALLERRAAGTSAGSRPVD